MNAKQYVMVNQRANRLNGTFYTTQRTGPTIDFPSLDKDQKKKPQKIVELSKVYGRKEQQM